MQALQTLYQCRRILWATSINDIYSKYKGTLLGIFWVIIYPLLFLSLYSIVFTMVFKVKIENASNFEYVLLIFSGLIPFLGFAESLGSGIPSIVANKSLIKNTLFPIELVPVKCVLTSSVTMCVSLVLLLLTLWFTGGYKYTQLFLPAIILIQWIFTIGVVWLLSAINVFLRDLNHCISIIVLFLMLISPIAYTMDMVPHSLVFILYFNPLYYLIALYRGILINGVIPFDVLLSFSIISLVLFYLGHSVFLRLKPLFSDYV